MSKRSSYILCPYVFFGGFKDQFFELAEAFVDSCSSSLLHDWLGLKRETILCFVWEKFKQPHHLMSIPFSLYRHCCWPHPFWLTITDLHKVRLVDVLSVGKFLQVQYKQTSLLRRRTHIHCWLAQMLDFVNCNVLSNLLNEIWYNTLIILNIQTYCLE